MVRISKVIGALAIVFGIIYIYNYRQVSVFKVKDVKIESSKIKNDIKITQISDFHSNKLIDLEELNSKIKAFNPDFIVLTGDMISREDSELDTVFRLLESVVELKKEVFYVKGNHERHNLLYGTLRDKMEELEIVVLEDKNKEIVIKDEKLNITGLDFFKKSEEEKEVISYEGLVNDLNADNYNIVLRHSPNDVENILVGNEDLILSGHTHGGQVRLPLVGSIVAPGQGFFPKHDKGLFSINDTKLYIDSGLGNSTLPIRLFNHVQISNIIISAN